MKKIAIIQTGGTIASKSSDKYDKNYSVSDVDLVEILPYGISAKAQISGVKFSQIDSKDADVNFWLNLADCVCKTIKTNDAIVITHGTDTMCETAYFLSLVLDTNKPIIITGAMRNSSSASSDGELNLYNSVCLAMHEKSSGVMIAINDEIHSAKDVIKIHSTNINAFVSPNFGKIGVINYGEVNFYNQTKQLKSRLVNTKEFIKTQIIYIYPGMDDEIFNIKSDVKGLVVIGYANATLPENVKNKLEILAKNGVIIVVSANTISGLITKEYENFITSNTLNPQKSRILLSLALSKTSNINEIKEYFLTH